MADIDIKGDQIQRLTVVDRQEQIYRKRAEIESTETGI
jgi:hypothetical protein